MEVEKKFSNMQYTVYRIIKMWQRSFDRSIQSSEFLLSLFREGIEII